MVDGVAAAPYSLVDQGLFVGYKGTHLQWKANAGFRNAVLLVLLMLHYHCIGLNMLIF